MRASARRSASSLMIFFHAQNLRAHRVAAQPGDVGVAIVARQYRQQPCAQHIALAMGVGTGVAQGAAIDPGVIHARGGQELGEEGQLCIRCGAGAVIPLHVNSTARRVHRHGIQCLRLNRQLTPLCFTHLVTSINPLKLPPGLAYSRFRPCQLPEIGLT